MAIKIQLVNLNKTPNCVTNIKNRSNKLLTTNTIIKQAAFVIPIVTTPIVAYKVSPHGQNQLKENLGKEALNKIVNNTTHDPITDRTKLNNKALEKAGVKASERAKYIKSDGYMDQEGKDICRNANVTSFKGQEGDNIEHFTHSNEHNNFHDVDIPQTSDIATIEAADIDIPDFTDFEDLSFADIAEILEDPALQAFAAEILPETRFLRPLRDLKRGDWEKAGIGTLTRTVEIGLAPVKLGWVACGSLMGTAFKVCGIDEEWTGPIGGAKQFAQDWAKGRDAIENELIGRETKEPELTPDQAYAQYKEAREKAIKDLREKIAARGEDYRTKLEKYFENSLLQYKNYNKYLEKLIAQEEQRQEFYSNQIASIISTGVADSESILKDIQRLEEKKTQLQKSYNEQIQQLDKYLQNNLSDEKTIQKIEERKQELQSIFETSNHALAEEISRVNNILNINKAFQQNKNLKGFAQIAGYDDVKDQLYKSFIRPAKLIGTDDERPLPNLILLYGPKGCGKTILAKSLKEESNSDEIKLNLTMNSDKDFENLMQALKNASDNYKLTGKHTIIRIDEINGFLQDKEVGDLMSTMAKDYHCTIIGTTNKPKEVNKSLINSEKAELILVEPANKRNLAKVLRYYLKNIAEVKFDYNKAAEILVQNSNGDFYSNSKIEGFIKNYIKTEFLKAGKFNSEDFLENLKNLKADIQAKEIQNFRKEIK